MARRRRRRRRTGGCECAGLAACGRCPADARSSSPEPCARSLLRPSSPPRPAAALVNPYNASLPRTPELTNIYMTSGLDVPLESKDWWGPISSEQDVAHLGGEQQQAQLWQPRLSSPVSLVGCLIGWTGWPGRQRSMQQAPPCVAPACPRGAGLVSVRRNVGGGSFLAGYKRSFADYSSLEVNSQLAARSASPLPHPAPGRCSVSATWLLHAARPTPPAHRCLPLIRSFLARRCTAPWACARC